MNFIYNLKNQHNMTIDSILNISYNLSNAYCHNLLAECVNNVFPCIKNNVRNEIKNEYTIINNKTRMRDNILVDKIMFIYLIKLVNILLYDINNISIEETNKEAMDYHRLKQEYEKLNELYSLKNNDINIEINKIKEENKILLDELNNYKNKNIEDEPKYIQLENELSILREEIDKQEKITVDEVREELEEEKKIYENKIKTQKEKIGELYNKLNLVEKEAKKTIYNEYNEEINDLHNKLKYFTELEKKYIADIEYYKNINKTKNKKVISKKDEEDEKNYGCRVNIFDDNKTDTRSIASKELFVNLELFYNVYINSEKESKSAFDALNDAAIYILKTRGTKINKSNRERWRFKIKKCYEIYNRYLNKIEKLKLIDFNLSDLNKLRDEEKWSNWIKYLDEKINSIPDMIMEKKDKNIEESYIKEESFVTPPTSIKEENLIYYKLNICKYCKNKIYDEALCKYHYVKYLTYRVNDPEDEYTYDDYVDEVTNKVKYNPN